MAAGVFVWLPPGSSARRARASQLTISPIKAVFSEADRATTYSVPGIDDFTSGARCCTYQWTLTLQKVDPNVEVDYGCSNHGILGGTAPTFVWHHGNVGDPVHDDGCDHTKQGAYGHQGLISVIVSDDHGGMCSATYKGTNSSDANAAIGQKAASEPVCTERDCDAQKAALAAAQARVAALEAALHTAGEASIKTLQAMHDALKRFDDLETTYNVYGRGKEELRGARLDYTFARIADAKADNAFDNVASQLQNAKSALASAQRDLTACLSGRSYRRLVATRPQAPSATAVCGAQKIALAQAQAVLSVYESAARSFAKAGLAQARARLLDAKRLIKAVRSTLPQTPTNTTLAKALDRTAASLGRAAARMGELNAAVGRLRAQVKPAQQQVEKAANDLAACHT